MLPAMQSSTHSSCALKLPPIFWIEITILKYTKKEPFFCAAVEPVEDKPLDNTLKMDSLAKQLRQGFEDLMKVAPNLTEEHSGMLKNIQKLNSTITILDLHIKIKKKKHICYYMFLQKK